MSDLKPCPFCGGEAELSTRNGRNGLTQYKYRCSKCHASIGRWHGGVSGHPWTALEAWNTRAKQGNEPPYDELLRCLENDWNISASWDGLRRFWHIGLTEEGVRLRDAELNSRAERTCVQVLTDYDDGLIPLVTAHCSACGAEWGFTPKYCHDCGAKVTGTRDERKVVGE